jgi:uncharacterized protein YndB with AHSA1/START domain
MTIDILSAIGAVTREVQTRDVNGRPAHVVLASRTYPTDVDDLWDALTSPERIPRWFMPISGDLRLGGRYQLEGNAGGEITQCEPPRLLAVTWAMGGGEPSWVTVRLSKQRDGALLQLEHVAHVPPEFWDQFGPGAVGVGWDGALYGLLKHLVTGLPNDPAAAATFHETEEGKAFYRASSLDWRRAAIAAGQDEAAAHEAAKRTYAFYTAGGDLL